MAKKIPVNTCIIKKYKDKTPKFHQYVIFVGVL